MGFQWTPSKISLQINKGHTSPAVDSDAVRGKKKYISLGRVFIRGTACSLEIYLKPHDRGGVWWKWSPN